MASRVVLPGNKKIEISNGDWLLVKTRLNAGEHRAILARMYDRSAVVDGQRVVDLTQTGLSIAVGYLLDWSLTNPDESRIEIRDQPPAVIAQALDSLDWDSFEEIRLAVIAHDTAMAQELAEEKKRMGTANGSNPT